MANVSTRVCASIVARAGGHGPVFLRRRRFFVLETKPYVATHEAMLEPLTKYLYRHPDSYLVFTLCNCLHIRNINTKYKSPETTRTLLAGTFTRFGRVPSGGACSSRGTRCPSKRPKRAIPHPMRFKRRARRLTRREVRPSPPTFRASVLARFLVSQPLTLPFPTSPPQPMPWRRDSRLPNPTHRAYRTRGTPATPWTPASVCSATTPDTSSAHVVAKRSSSRRPRMNR